MGVNNSQGRPGGVTPYCRGNLGSAENGVGIADKE